MKEEEYIIKTNHLAYECEDKISLRHKTQVLDSLGIDYEVYKKVNGETRKILVDISDFVKSRSAGGF